MRGLSLIVSCTAVIFASLFGAEAQSVTAGTATGTISACVGTASASPNIQQFTISGSNLTGNITAAAPTGFEVSLSATSGYSKSVTLTPSAGAVAGTVVYVCMAASAPAGPVSGNVTISSPGATSQTVAVSGIVNTPATVNAIADQTVNDGATTAAINFTGSGNSFTWVNNTPAIGLAAAGAGNIAPFTTINTGTKPITATVTITPSNTPFAYIANYGASTVSVINTVSNQVIATIPVGALPIGVAVSPISNLTYVTNYNENTVSVIDNTKNAVVATISSGINLPYGIAASPDGSKVFVANTSDVAVINTGTNTVVDNIPLSVFGSGLAVSPDGTTLYASNADMLAVINTATKSIINIPKGGANGIAVSPDGSQVYLAAGGYNGSIKFVNTATNTITDTIAVDSVSLEGICVSPDGSRVYAAGSILSSVQSKFHGVVLVINTKTKAITDTINFSYDVAAFGVSITPDGKKLYVANDNYGAGTVSAINTANNTVSAVVLVGLSPVAFGDFISPGSNCSTPTTFTITVNPPPLITVGTASGSITACAGSASDSPNIQQFIAYGQYGTSNITVTAPTGFEVSLSATSGYGQTVTLDQLNDSVRHTIIYVRSSASAPAGGISGNVTLSSASAATQMVAVSGIVNALPVVNFTPDQNATNGTFTTAISFTGTGDAYSWVNKNPAIGLAVSGSGDIPAFTALDPSGTPAVATITVTPVSSATGCTGLPQSFTITVTNPLLQPKIVAGGSLSPLSTTYGTPSASTSFSVSGANLTANVLVSRPTGFELSLDNVVYSNSVSITPSAANNSPTTVYIRLAAVTPVGFYSDNIQCTSTNATPVDLAMPLSTVSPAPLTITADDKSRYFDQPNPVLTATYSGFVNNDGPPQLTTLPAITTTAVITSPVGQYPITVSGAASPNYSITYVEGILSINALPPRVFVPNTFTPNGDGINDTWNIKYINLYPNCYVQIFSKWGQKVFSSTGYGAPWDGTYANAKVAAGTYYYIIDLKNGSGLLSGWVAVVW